MKQAVLVLLFALLGSSLSVPTGEAQPPQPGATQGGPTTGREMMPVCDMRYCVGEWEIEWTPLDTPLLPGGKYTGTETIRHIENGRYFDVTVELEGPDGGLSGKGIMLFESGPFGSHLTRYVVYDAPGSRCCSRARSVATWAATIASSGRHPSRFTTTTHSF